MLELDCCAQNYAWGKFGTDSAVASLKSSSSNSFKVNPKECYAELWMGTHPSGPSKVARSQQNLLDWIRDHNDSVGVVPAGYLSNDLPFLFKVLSVRTALSIQAHPDKALAQQLFAKFPDIYKDDNHKPEMAVALTEFECMCGFRSPQEIQQYCAAYPELNAIISQGGYDITKLDSSGDVKANIRAMFEAYMTCSEEVAQQQLSAAVSRLQGKGTLDTLEQLFLRLNSQYPGDRGAFAPLLLNFLTLAKGESFFIGANEPHAYISGDCMECMALSDNVVRAGLTPKFKDVETLCNMLHYNYGRPTMLNPLPLDNYTSVYRPPLDSCAEFEVEVTNLQAETTYSLVSGNYASIVIVSEGSNCSFKSQETIPVTAGTVLFIAANVSVEITTTASSVQFYRAHVNLSEN